MPFQNLVCPAAPLIGHLLLHSSSQRTLIYIVDALRAPRGGFPFSTSGGVDSLQHPFPLFLSLFLSRHSVLHSRCRSLNRLARLPSPSLSLSLSLPSIPINSQTSSLCHLPFSLPLSPLQILYFASPVFDLRSRSRFCSSCRHPLELHPLHHPPVLGLRTFLGGGDFTTPVRRSFRPVNSSCYLR